MTKITKKIVDLSRFEVLKPVFLQDVKIKPLTSVSGLRGTYRSTDPKMITIANVLELSTYSRQIRVLKV